MPDPGPLALLRLLPAGALNETGIRVASYDALLAAQGVAGGGSDLAPDAWFPALGARPMLPHAGLDPMNPDWRAGLGFDLRDVAAMVEAGPSETNILLLTGRFDAAALTTAWEAGGYTATETGGVTWHTLGEDNVLFDPDVPLSDWHVGMLSHLALLDDGTVVGTARRAEMEQVLALHGGAGGSFADDPGAALVAAAVPDLASGWIVDTMALVAVGDPLAGMQNNPNLPAGMPTQAAGLPADAPAMPQIALALVGMTAGGAGAAAGVPQPHAVAVAVPVDPRDAGMVAEAVTARLEAGTVPSGEGIAGRPYREVFTAMSIEATPAGAVVIDLTPAPGVDAGVLIRLQESRLLTILQWAG